MNLSLFDPPFPPFSPDYGCPPGETLREVLERLGLTQAELADRTGRPKKTINEIVQGKAAITPDTALQFERVLHIDATFWLNLERAYQAAQARDAETERLTKSLPWLETLPVNEMVRRGWIPRRSDRVELLREVLSFFGIAFPDAWDDVWRETQKATALRQGQSQDVDFGAIAVWLRRGEIEGRSRQCSPYDAGTFRDVLSHVRTLTTLPAETFCLEIKEHCASAGVAVVFLPEFQRLKIFGAARWLSPDKALIQLSLYYKREDQLLFSFFHEAAHVLLHGRRDIFVDFATARDNREEIEANRFAQDHLIPPLELRRFIARANYSQSSLLEFARDVGIAAGIVVGRLQHDRNIRFNQLNELRQRVTWSAQGVVRIPSDKT